METRQVAISSIVVRDEVQQRVSINEECVKEYAEEIAGGKTFPPLIVFSEGEDLSLADGRHRYEAYKIAGIEMIDVEVHEGGLREAKLYAVGANADHGLRRTNADKRKSVSTLLTDQEWKTWSDRVIAEKCRVSQPFVTKLREELSSTDNGYQSDVRKCKNGRTMKTKSKKKVVKEKAAQPSISGAANQGGESEHKDAEPAELSSPIHNDNTTNTPSPTTGAAGENADTTKTETSRGESQNSDPNEISQMESEEGVADTPISRPEDNRSVEALNQRITELENSLSEKDRLLCEKEKRIEELEQQIEYLYKQLEDYASMQLPDPKVLEQAPAHDSHMNVLG